MGTVIFLLVVLIFFFYWLAADGIREDRKRAAKQKAEQPIKTIELQERRTVIDDGQSINLDVKRTSPIEKVSPAKVGRSGLPTTYPNKNSNQEIPQVKTEDLKKQHQQQTVSRPIREQRAAPEKKEKQFVETRERRTPTRLSLSTGIKELDGPGMFHRLTGQGPNASAVYLLYSKQHNAYKVGYCKPTGIAGRIKQVRPEVPDVILDGTAVFTSSQNAFDAEQKILKKYKKYKYSGINGRWSGSTEWITKRPTGRPYFTKPSAVESKYEQELQAETERPIEADIYTVYLMKSVSKGMHKVSWCKTENITTKLRTAQRSFASDVRVVSRFPIQSRFRARGIAKKINEDAGTFRKEGRQETFEWTTDNSYLNQFKSWSPEGKQIS